MTGLLPDGHLPPPPGHLPPRTFAPEDIYPRGLLPPRTLPPRTFAPRRTFAPFVWRITFGQNVYSNTPISATPHESVKVVDNIYLGHPVTKNRQNPLVEETTKDFTCKVNEFSSYFDKVNCDVKSVLFKLYCTSFMVHRYVLYMMELLRFLILHRTAPRRIWGLPYRTRRKLLPHIVRFYMSGACPQGVQGVRPPPCSPPFLIK